MCGQQVQNSSDKNNKKRKKEIFIGVQDSSSVKPFT